MAGDLHTHTTFSDGSTDVEVLLDLASRANINYIAVSDHDTALSIKYAQNNPVINSVKLISAVELTCFDQKRQRRVHLLCYLPDLTNELYEQFKLMGDRRNFVINKSIAKIEKLYPLFCQKAAFNYAKRSKVVFKTHLIRVLFECGYTDGIFKSLYNELFDSKKGIALYEPEYESIDKILQIIQRANGVAVLAHPSVYKSMELAEQLAKEQRIDGIEVWHPRNNEEDIKKLLLIAQEYNLIVTGGSDFHGMYMSKPNPLGSFVTADEEIEKIFSLSKRRKSAKI